MAMPPMSEAAFNEAVAVQIRASFLSNEFGIAVMNAYDNSLEAEGDQGDIFRESDRVRLAAHMRPEFAKMEAATIAAIADAED